MKKIICNVAILAFTFILIPFSPLRSESIFYDLGAPYNNVRTASNGNPINFPNGTLINGVPIGSGGGGNTILNGSGAPSNGTGSNGDFYIDTTAHAIYGPKAAGVWGSSTGLTGPAGATGAAGATGQGVPTGGTAGQVLSKINSTNYNTQWITVSGSGTVTSVGLSLPAIFTITVSPVNTSGTLTATLATETANTHFAGPTSGGAAIPTFRALVGADLPNPGVSSLGGVQSAAAASHNFQTGINTSGVPQFAQPADSDLSVTDITTNNSTTSTHGFQAKGINDTSKFYDSTGGQSIPSISPINTISASYSLIASDAGKTIFHNNASAHTVTIPPNSGGGSVAYPIGTIVTIINADGSGTLTISITTDTLRRGDGTAGTGSRTVPADSIITLIKTQSTEWYIMGKFS